MALADVVTDWNLAMTHYSEIQPPPGIDPFVEAKIYAMAHVAMRNAIVEVDGNPRLNADAAMAQAAHDVLVVQLPGGSPDFDALLRTHLHAISSGEPKSRGVQLGAAKARAMIAARVHDGSANANGPYTPGTNPGDYRPTPPFDGPPFNGFVTGVHWGQVTPFSLKCGSQFRVPPPYKVTDLAYTFDLNEIKALGSATSTVRSPDQTELALFWYESTPMGWNRIARLVDGQYSRTALDRARLFASLNVALADAYIASFDSKFTYNFWRPFTAIHLADTDGNPSTTGDPTWEPLFLTPPIPDYPSAHACAGGAASTVLIAQFGDEQTFELTSTLMVPFGLHTRKFSRISDAAKENAFSRMLVGIHFRQACETGLAQGHDIGMWVVRHEEKIK